MNQNKGLAGPRRAGDDAVAAVDFAGNGFLVVIQHFYSVLLLFVLCYGITVGQFNSDNGEDQLTEVIELIRRQVKVKGGGVFLLQGFQKGLAGRVSADVRLRVQIVPEKDPVRVNDLVEGFPDVFILVDIGEYDSFMDGDFRVPGVMRLFGDQATVIPNLVHKAVAVGFCLP